MQAKTKKTENKPLELVESLALALGRVGPDSQLEVLEPQVVPVRAPQRQHLRLEGRLNRQPKLPGPGQQELEP